MGGLELTILLYPLALNSATAFASLAWGNVIFPEHLWFAYFMVASSSVTAFSSIYFYLLVASTPGASRPTASTVVTFLFGQALLLILIFAGIHAAYDFTTTHSYDVGDKVTAIYFSIVTWTTLGYGDFAPHKDLRLIAAIEAFVGFVFLGLIIGIVVQWLNEHMK